MSSARYMQFLQCLYQESNRILEALKWTVLFVAVFSTGINSLEKMTYRRARFCNLYKVSKLKLAHRNYR